MGASCVEHQFPDRGLNARRLHQTEAHGFAETPGSNLAQVSFAVEHAALRKFASARTRLLLWLVVWRAVYDSGTSGFVRWEVVVGNNSIRTASGSKIKR